jgi:hypothetical protein
MGSLQLLRSHQQQQTMPAGLQQQQRQTLGKMHTGCLLARGVASPVVQLPGQQQQHVVVVVLLAGRMLLQGARQELAGAGAGAQPSR